MSSKMPFTSLSVFQMIFVFLCLCVDYLYIQLVKTYLNGFVFTYWMCYVFVFVLIHFDRLL